MSTVPYKGMTDSDKQGVKEALAIRFDILPGLKARDSQSEQA